MAWPLVALSLAASVDWALGHVRHPSGFLEMVREWMALPERPQAPPGTAHLWFLYYLAMCCVPLIGCFLLGPRLAPGGLARAGDALFRGLVGRWWAPALLAVAGAPILWTMRDWWIDTPQGWRPNKVIYLYYLGFFLFGAMLYRHRDRLAAFGRHWAALLVIANVAVMPAMLKLTITGNRLEDAGTASAMLVG